MEEESDAEEDWRRKRRRSRGGRGGGEGGVGEGGVGVRAGGGRYMQRRGNTERVRFTHRKLLPYKLFDS